MRLIDADKIKCTSNGCMHPYCKDNCEFTKDGGLCGWLVVHKRDIDDMPTVDAVPVVRCKDCKYNKNGRCYITNLTKNINMRIEVGSFVKDTDFCSRGERKTDD